MTKLAIELETLIRAGSPLGPGLRTASLHWKGSLRPAAERLALRLDSGVPVDEALRTSPELPTLFRSLAAAGLATNRAADVLAAWSASTRQLLELRERLVRGLMYPAIVVLMAYGLFIMLVSVLLPQLAQMVADVSRSAPWWAEIVDRLRDTLPIWSWAIPASILALWGISHLFLFQNRSVLGWWGGLPIVHGILGDIHMASSSHLLAALLECEVSLPLALSLASESLASPTAQRSIGTITDEVRRGVPPAMTFRGQAGAPPLWRELFARETDPAKVRSGLLHVAEVLSERARNRADALGNILPGVLIIVIGGTAVAGYATLVFGPLVTLWDRMGGAS